MFIQNKINALLILHLDKNLIKVYPIRKNKTHQKNNPTQTVPNPSNGKNHLFVRFSLSQCKINPKTKEKKKINTKARGLQMAQKEPSLVK